MLKVGVGVGLFSVLNLQVALAITKEVLWALNSLFKQSI